jgi:CheY-like chemotaxis protein
VLELLSDRPNQNRTQVTSAEPGIVTQLPDACIEIPSRPLAPQLDADLFWLQNDAVIAGAESPPAGSATKTILIVDDDRSVADTFARMLKLEGFEVATAVNAEAGLELAENVRPSAIILDMRMPITNGLQFLRSVRAKPHLVDVPVAIVTGDYFLSDPIQQELKSLGESIRFKPLWLEVLIALAKSLVA